MNQPRLLKESTEQKKYAKSQGGMAGGKGIVFVQSDPLYKMKRSVEVLEEFKGAHIIYYNRLNDAYHQGTNTCTQAQNKTVAIFEEQ